MLLRKHIPVSYILNHVKYDLGYILVVSVVVLFATHSSKHFLPDMPLTIPAFIGTALSIIISFKLNQSYDRWWEARKVWGSIVNDSRSLVMQLQSFASAGEKNTIKKIALRQIAWCYSLGQSLRGQDPLKNMEKFISPHEIESIKKHNNKPLAMLQLHCHDIKELKENEKMELFAQVQLDETLVRLCDSQGRAERIKTTIFPVTYTLFLHGIIYLFVGTLSIALKEVDPLFEIPLLLVISCAFLLLEKAATHMQDPFADKPTDTAVTAIARTIEINIKQLLNETDIPKPVEPERFYIK